MPGSLAQVESERGEFIGVGLLNPLSQIICRMLTRGRESIDEAFFAKRIGEALAKREKLFSAPYYRLLHGEADFLPGLIIDRFGDICVVQVASAGMEKLQSVWLAALEKAASPKAVLLRNDFSARKLEGLTQHVTCIKGEVPALVKLEENDCFYFADIQKGQKTGWFYDMRDNRKMVAELAVGKTVLDVFSHSGGFGVLAAKAGAKGVTMVDSSRLALDLAMQAAAENKVEKNCDTLCGDAVEVMKKLAQQDKKYDIVIADPPAYVKSKKDIAAGLRGYEKVAQYASALVAENGLLFTASCSHHAGRSAFNKAVLAGLEKAGRKAEIIKQTGASRDHPLHAQLPQSEYLKGLLLKLI